MLLYAFVILFNFLIFLNVYIFTFMHLADAFIQSDLHSGYTIVLSVCVFPGNQTHNLWVANAML